MAAEHPDKIAAVGVVAALLGSECQQWPRVGPAVSLLLIEGTGDRILPVDGGPVHILDQDRGQVLSYADNLHYWVARNGCSDPPTRELKPLPMPIKVERWSGRDGSEVEGWRVEGMGHVWPGSLQYLPVRVIGPTTYEFDCAEAIWSFLSRHSR